MASSRPVRQRVVENERLTKALLEPVKRWSVTGARRGAKAGERAGGGGSARGHGAGMSAARRQAHGEARWRREGDGEGRGRGDGHEDEGEGEKEKEKGTSLRLSARSPSVPFDECSSTAQTCMSAVCLAQRRSMLLLLLHVLTRSAMAMHRARVSLCCSWRAVSGAVGGIRSRCAIRSWPIKTRAHR